MKILVTAGSKHGSTEEIARAIGEVLKKRDIDTTVSPIGRAPSPEGYDAVVIGSAVYAGHWTKAAKAFIEKHAEALAARPVWLFSSGPLGDPLKPDEDPLDVPELMRLTSARDHCVFAGRLDRSDLGFAERAIVKAVRAPYGDYRDWNEIWNWSTQIADALQPAPVG